MKDCLVRIPALVIPTESSSEERKIRERKIRVRRVPESVLRKPSNI